MSSALGLCVAYSTDLLVPATVFRFSGASVLAQPFTTSAPFPAAAFTVALWMQSQSATGTIVDYASSGGSHLTVSAPGAVRVALDQSAVTTAVSAADGRWHHLALAFERRGRAHLALSLYLDGQLAYRAPGALSASAGGLQPVGQLTLGPLSADVSNLQLWSAAQQPLEVLSTMNRRLVAGAAGPALSWWLDSLQSEGPNTIDSFFASTLQFREPTAAAAGWVLASFTADGTSTYVLQAVSGDGLWMCERITTAGALEIPGVLLGRPYRARVGKRTGTSVAYDDPVELLPIDLAAPTLTMSWPATLTAAWSPVDQAGAYAVGVVGAPATVQTATATTALHTHLGDSAAVLLAVRAQLAAIVGTAGPASNPPATTAPLGVAFLFDPGYDGPNQELLEASWTPAQPADPFVYAVVGKQGAPTSFSGHEAGAAGKLTLALPGAGYEAPDTLQCALRAVRAGALGSFATQTLTVRDLGSAPILHPLVLNATGRAVTIAWDFDESRFSGDVRYRVSVVMGGVEQGPIETATKAATWTAPSDSDGALVRIRVRAIALQNLGRWSAAATFKVGTTLGAPTITGACVNAALTLTAAWSAVPGASAYRLTLRNGSTFAKTLEVGNVTTTDWPVSATGLQPHTQYTLTVTARAQNTPDGPESAPFPVDSGTLCPGTNTTPVGEPINQVTGQYIYAHLDLAVPGVVPLELVTYYTSPLAGATPGASVLGPYWSHGYDIRLTISAAVATVAFGDGGVERFAIPASLSGECAKFGPPNGDRLVAEVDGTYTLTRRDGRALRFDAGGVLQSIARRDGNALTLAYSGGLLATVTDAGSGRALKFTYQNGLLESVACGTLSASFARDATGDLTRVTNPAGRHRDFTYATGSLLEGATDENGHLFVTNRYGGDRRIESQQTPRGTLSLSYLDGHDANGFATVVTTILDAAGYTTKYYATVATQQVEWEMRQLTTAGNGDVQVIGRVYDGLNRLAQELVYQGPAPAAIPPVLPLSANTASYRHDGAGNLIGVTAPCGTSAAASYNADGTLASATDILGNTTLYTWSGGLLRRIEEPLGYRTEFLYADVGAARNLVEQVAVYPGNAGLQTPVANVTSFEYQPTGELEKITAPGGAVEIRTYDALGRQTGRTVGADAQPPLLSETYELEPATGWRKTVHRCWGAQTAAQAYVESYTYDALGFVSTYTDPLGGMTRYGYTDDNLPSSVAYPAPSGRTPETTALFYDGYGRLDRVLYASSPSVAYAYDCDPLGRPRTFTDANGKATAVTWTLLAATGGYRNLQRTTTYPQVTGASGPEQQREILDPLGRVVAVTNVTLTADQATAPTTSYAYAVLSATGANRYSITTTLPPAAAGGQSTTRVTIFDARGRPVQVSDERGKLWSTVYDTVVEGGVVYERARRSDPLGNVVVVLSDPFGRVVRRQVLDTDAATVLADTRIARDALGRETTVLEPRRRGRVAAGEHVRVRLRRAAPPACRSASSATASRPPRCTPSTARAAGAGTPTRPESPSPTPMSPAACSPATSTLAARAPATNTTPPGG